MSEYTIDHTLPSIYTTHANIHKKTTKRTKRTLKKYYNKTKNNPKTFLKHQQTPST